MAWYFPPEWHPQDWLWIGFPHDADEWPDFLAPAQHQIASFANAVAESGQAVRLLVRDGANASRARALVSAGVSIEQRAYGDIWLRDTGPLVQLDGAGGRRARRFAFNGWGGKYLMAGDQTIGAELARDAGLAVRRRTGCWKAARWTATVPGSSPRPRNACSIRTAIRDFRAPTIEARLSDDLGFARVLWLGDGLINDHTDGHVDNLARFVAPGVLGLPVADRA